MRNKNSLQNKVAVVTGAARGIGRGIALSLSQKGVKVVIADIDKEEAERTGQELKKLGGKVFNFSTDVASLKENKRLVKQLLEEFGRIDILINNAGVNIPYWGLLEEREETQDESVFATNLLGPYFLTQQVAREMVARKIKGNIIFISSIHSRVTQLHPAYCASKAALEMLTRDLALELAPWGIRVNSIAPGAISIREEVDPQNPDVPLGYSGMPSDIAQTVLFLLAARYITGETIVVDGGLSLTHVFWERFKKEKLK